MKRAGHWLLSVMFVLLFFWSCQALVEKPEAPEAPVKLPPAPIQAMWMAVPRDAPVQARMVIAEGEALLHKALAVQQETDAPSNGPTRDRNGVPLTGRSYVRTVYTACRLEETAG